MDENNVADNLNKSLEAYYKRNEQLEKIPMATIRKAWFTMAHLLVDPGSHVVNMGCADGMMTYAMAALYPQIKITGLDIDKKAIRQLKQKYKLPNLEFISGDATTCEGLEEQSIDAIVNSFILHDIYSNSRYNDRPVVRTLEKHFSLLKPGGLMFVRDYPMPSPGEYVMLEMPDIESKGKTLPELSEPDLLVWYSENARPRDDAGCNGFFMEELPARFPGTRLFRLPYKWAYEFIMRKDDREHWETELPKEYTFFTPREYRKTLRAMGARVLYTAPYRDDGIIRKNYEGHFHLYDDEGVPLGAPATSYIAVAQKIREGESIRLMERRPSQGQENHLRVTAMRNEKTGQVYDIVTRDKDLVEVLPYRITEEGELNIYLHEGLPRGIVNAVPRIGKDLDGKRWSGYMTEALTVESYIINDVEKGGLVNLVKFARDHLGLKPGINALLQAGPTYFPAPDYIDERIQTRYLRVEEKEGPIIPKVMSDDIQGFSTSGRIREVSAQHILNAIAAGFIPNARLELQIQALFDMLEIKAESWVECPLTLTESKPEKILDGKELLDMISQQDNRYRPVKGTTGEYRNVHSIFVEEGWVSGGIMGMKSRDLEFVISDDKTVNTAVVLPLTKDIASGEVLAGIVTEYLPVPQRYKGNGMTIRAPSFPLPKEITTIDQARQYIADIFGVGIEKVARMGESYFCHIGITPQRVFPFAVATDGRPATMPNEGVTQYTYMKYIWGAIGPLFDYDFDEFFLDILSKCFTAYVTEGIESEWKQRKKIKQDHSEAVHKGVDVTGLNLPTPPPMTPEHKMRAAPPPDAQKNENKKETEEAATAPIEMAEDGNENMKKQSIFATAKTKAGREFRLRLTKNTANKNEHAPEDDAQKADKTENKKDKKRNDYPDKKHPQ